MTDACVRVFPKQFCKQQANVLQNHDNGNVQDIEQGEAQHSQHKTPEPGRSQGTDLSLAALIFQS